MKKIVVFGSFAVDLMGRGPHLPVPGETVKSGFFQMGPGGKGFNQGVAAHKAGGSVTMVTKLGRDAFANVALDTMKALGMDASRIITTDKYPTGTALILVDEATGQNAIMVVPSACDHIEDGEVDALRDLVADADFVLTQLETNMSAIRRMIEMASELGKTVILNTAPVQPVDDELLSKVSIVTPNEVEAGILTGIPVTDAESAGRAADWFLARGVKRVVITMGGMGAFVADGALRRMTPAFSVEALDTTGAGDAYNGGFVTALAEGRDLIGACRFAAATAALSVQRMGTTPSMPTRAEIDAFLAEHP